MLGRDITLSQTRILNLPRKILKGQYNCRNGGSKLINFQHSLGPDITYAFIILLLSAALIGCTGDDSIIKPVGVDLSPINTAKLTACSSHQFLCHDQLKCIDKSQVCDLSVDCYDGSDEEANCPQIPCKNGTFQCQLSKRCIPLGWLCDGTSDCGFTKGHILDQSDEHNDKCHDEHVCQPNSFKCGDGISCIKIVDVCNGLPDCPDGSDEDEFCRSPGLCANASHCKYGCRPTTNGPVCYCPIGKEFNGTKCIDSNECSTNGACDQLCASGNRGKKQCSCVSGYEKDGPHCRAINNPKGAAPLLLYQDATDIKWIHLNGSDVANYHQYKSPHSGILGIDFDHLVENVCWINHDNVSSIMRCANSTRLSSFKDKPHPYLYSFKDVFKMAFDWISQNYYFVDDAREMIFVCRKDLDICRSVVDTDLSKPRGLAIDPTAGFMFFTVWGASRTGLDRALLDGSDRIPLVSTKIVYPYGITVDIPTKHIYWVDKFLDSVERVDYDGQNRRTVHRGIQHLHDITVFENNLYLVSWQQNKIISLKKFETMSNKTLKMNDKKPLGILAYHRQRQPRGKPHPCFSTHKCDEFCFPFWQNATYGVAKCGCREGSILQPDEKKCAVSEKSAFVIFTKQKTGIMKSFSLRNNIDISVDMMVPVVNRSQHLAFDYDAISSNLYYSDRENFRIMKKGLGNPNEEIFIAKDVSFVEGMAVDWMGQNLYWTDENLNTIHVASLRNPEYKKLLVHANLTNPRSIVVDPKQGYVYWSNFAKSNERDGSIERMWMDGSHREELVRGLGWPIGLSMDHENGLLYYSDALEYTLERIRVTGSQLRKEILFTAKTATQGQPSDVAYFNGTIYMSVNGEVRKTTVSPKPLADWPKQIEWELVRSYDIAKIKVFDGSLQGGTNKCSGDHLCPQLCLTIPQNPGTVCACQDGYDMSSNGQTCEKISNYTHPLTCDAAEFTCHKFPKCINERAVCDGTDDCGDGSDEDTSPEGKCESTTTPGICERNYFHCGKGICIPSQAVCDGKPDCANQKDESSSSCSNMARDCYEHEFMCIVSKRCIPKMWKCDGEFDCGESDTSDEKDCAYPECSRTQFQCQNSSCIPLESLCDGYKDCLSGEDEDGCMPYCTRMNMTYCEADNKCIDSSYKCDGHCHCSDGEDELGCPITTPLCARAHKEFICEYEMTSLNTSVLSHEDCLNISCGSNTFRCHDGTQCIPLHMRCDSIHDCSDGTDETNCPTQLVECHYPDRLCDNGAKCVNVRQLCDTKFDCADKTDEGPKCEDDPCGRDRASNCSHSCQKTPEGHICYCPRGMHLLQTDKANCVDDHPCDQWGTCSQGCKKIGKRYSCICLPEYALKEDNITCKSVHPDTPYLVFSNRHELREINLHNPSSFNSLISNLRNSIALDFYHKDNTYQIFWTDVVDDRIYKGSLNGGSLINIDIVIQTGLATAEGLAVDWIGENLYWVESNLDQIEVAKLNGSFRKTLISGEMYSPRSIALDPQVGFLFWTDWEADAPRIERASMSGEYRQVVFKVGQMGEGAWPNGLTLDYSKHRIYWVDARLDSIHSTKYDGTDFRTILSDHEALSHPFAISVFESNLYWTDWRSNSVMRANKFTGKNVTTIQKTYTQPFDVKIFHPSRQPRNIKNPCGNNNGLCSHLCLLNINQTFTCGCPHLMVLGPDNKICIPNEKMLLFSRLNEIRAVYLDKSYYHAAPPVSYPLIVSPANLHFVAKYKQIYWCDAQSGETKRANVSSPRIDTLIDGAAGKPLAIGVDWISDLIFIAVQNPSRNSISVTNLNGEFYSTIIQGKNDLKNINSIAVNPHKAQIYWPEGNSKSQFSIQMAHMDGSKRSAITSSRDNTNLEHPVSLSYDFQDDRLYWVNYNTERIQYHDFKTNKVQTISFGNLKPNVITVYHDYVYFASEKQDAILKGNKTVGGQYEFVRNNTENIYSIRVYDPDEQNGTNPCSLNKGGCQHLCLPVSNSKRICKCALGYVSDETNPTKCKSMDTVIVYVDSSGIKGVSSDPKSIDDLLVPIPLVNFATDIDVDENNEYLYWLDNDKGRISRIKRDGTHRETVLKDLEAAIGLAIDWNAGNMYWANPKDSMIEVAHVNGTSHYVLITDNLDKPMSLAVDPAKGYLFWSDIAKGVIERSHLDGTNRKVIVNSEPMRIADIALDMENERIYWCDSPNDKIESATYDGGSRSKVLSGDTKSHLHSPLIDKGVLYWIDMGHQGGSIMSAPVNNINQPIAVKEGLGATLKDLGVFSTKRQQGKNACGQVNGGCQDLCLFNGTHPVCICAHGKIDTDGKSCKPYEAFLAFSRVSSIETIHISDDLTPNAPHPTIMSGEHIRNAIGLAYDFKNQKMFYSDVQLGTVNSVHFNGTNFTIIVEKQGSVEGLYYEAAHSDLYWTCSNDASINRINPYLPGAKVEKILKLSSNDKPRGITVDPCESRIYWTNWDVNKPSIQRAFMSGYQVESIVTTEIRMPNGLTLDHVARKLYWVDARLDKIERCELDGTGRKIIASEKPKHAFSIAVLGDYIYWSDWVLHSVVRADKYTGENVQILRTDILKPMGIVAVSKQEEECLKNPCNILNGGCAEICALDEYGNAACKCGAGKVAQENGRCVIQPKNRENCTNNEFQCVTGSCIDYELTCDGISHCPDSSDEDNKYCATRKCKDGFFQCLSNRCIKMTKRCDGTAHCQSNEDELNCTCSADQFQCVQDGRCIDKVARCNKTPDCSDVSDEMNCGKVDCLKNISASTGPMEFYQCPHTTACIHKSWECDGANDCWDNSDEKNCSEDQAKSKKECHPNSFSCGDGSCILRAWVCDMDVDCETGEDERNCKYTCKPQQFVCDSGECISLMWRCDGTHDCSDGSDEGDKCSDRSCDDDKQFKCNSTGRCIPKEYVCDGDEDCQNGEDESPPEGCANVTRSSNVLGVCSPHQFQCKNGICIAPEWVCDNEKDCHEGEDEENCPQVDKCDGNSSDGQPCVSVQCEQNQFKCNNGRCISSNGKCNGMNDCGDLSDESDTLCGKDKYCTAEYEFLCKNNVCVNETQLCNGQNDCGDSSDEIGCGINECDNPQNELKVCQHTCIDKKVGYECKCWKGFKPSPTNPHACIDINECEERACSQKCRNSLSSYKCSCLPNYILKEDGHSCKANSSEPVKLLLSNQYYIRMVDNHGTTSLLAQNLTNAVALDYDWEGGCIYFSDVTAFGSSIKRLCIASKNSADIRSESQLQEETLHYITVQSPDGLAVDWVGKNLYWCDKGTDTIEVSRLDGSFRKILIHDKLQEPRGIALDPLQGQLFWTDWGDEPYIGRAGMDGSNFKILISENLGWPNALTISHETNELFWADAKEDYIAVADFNGENRKTIHSRGMYANVFNPTAKIHHIFAITTFEDTIWWSDWETKSVEKCHKYNGMNETRVTTTIHRPMDVKVFHPFRQPPRHPNPCENRGSCQTLCLLSPGGGAVCACPEDFILTENQRNCTNNCTSSQFECKSTLKCIPSWWVCDGQKDCSSTDDSDEPKTCPPFKCTPGQYQCSSGECIHPASLCDAKEDCHDGSDEKDCDKHTCFGTQFKCEGNATVKSFCIHQTQRCDGTPNCPGGQDELLCQSKTCPPNQYTCHNKKCIQPEWTCDMEDDCGDGSDEIPHINCTRRSCDTNNKFRCRSGKCIPLSWHCDGEKDCHEGEDEPEACSNPEEHSCEPSYFRCSNHRCIPSRWHCDYDDDCGDNSDEENCKPRNCSESEWKCDDGRCIRKTLQCNGEYNCQDRSDEKNCNTTCTLQDFVCENPKFCINAGWKCDGDADCLDGTDELNCGNKTACHPDLFKCTNGECISLNWVCDGEKDCADGTDEETAMCKNTVCEPGKFRCRSNNICIPYSKTCDGENDCPDGSDEQTGMCPQRRQTCQKDQFQCETSHKCINNSLVCDSINDCLDGSDELECFPCTFGSCSHTCVVKKPTGALKQNYTCECADGYRISHIGNRSSCHALGEEAFMLVATENEVLKTNPSKPIGEDTEIVMNDSKFHSKVESLDYLLETDRLVRVFYTTGIRRSIQELQLSLQIHGNSLSRLEKREAISSVKDVVTGLDEPKGIAVDWVAERIYWLDSGHRTLSVSTLDGKTRLALINKGIVEPYEIVLDPESGRMYWSDWTDQRIGVANMDGSGKKTLVQSPCPMGLAIDYPARRLYWTDIKSHTLETVTLDGRDRHIVKRFKGGDMKPNRIDIFEDYVYLTSYHPDKIYRMNKFGKEEPVHWPQRASDTLLIQSNKKRHYPNPCSKMICQHPGLCLISGNNTATCVCPDGKGSRSSSNKTHETYTCKSVTAEKCDLKCKQGKCVIDNGIPKCQCSPLYQGLLCEVYRCSGYCMNRGICYEDLTAMMDGDKVHLKCDCPPDYTGDRCETPVVSCKGHCQNNGKCNENNNTCICPPGYVGRLCEACEMHRCENNGVCKLDLKNTPLCQCPKGYSGYRCEKTICDNYCMNKGKCKVKNGNPECSCITGYKGKKCEEDMCEQLCYNGGRCESNSNGLTCTCSRPFVGVRCEYNLCDCQKCVKNNPKCQCPPNINTPEEYCYGSNISLSARCKSSSCKHSGVCVVIDDQPYCRCLDSWVGARCEIPAPADKPCHSYCMHGGICIMQDTAKKPECKCLLGWTGLRCELKTACTSGFCFNGGTCVPNPDESLQPSCNCLEEFYGLRCATRMKASLRDDSEDSGITWVLVLVFIVVAASVAGFSGCMAYVVMRRKQYGFNRGRPFMHVRMHDAGTVEINNPMFLKEEGDEDHTSEPSLIFDSDKVLLQGTNFANPVYETMYKEGESSAVSDEKKGLLQGEDFSSSGDHPLADPLA